jgi:hypothetical protein
MRVLHVGQMVDLSIFSFLMCAADKILQNELMTHFLSRVGVDYEFRMYSSKLDSALNHSLASLISLKTIGKKRFLEYVKEYIAVF